MNITIKINTDNTAFENQIRVEVARILLNLAKVLEYGETLDENTKLPLYDINGNNVGYLTVKA